MNTTHIKDKIINALPEFVSYLEDIDIDEQSYFYFGNPGLFLSKEIEKNNKDIIDKAFDLVNELLELNDTQLDNLINIGVLEVLTDTMETQRAAYDKLNKKGKVMFITLFDRFHKLI
jgi:RNA binding exosome subunit